MKPINLKPSVPSYLVKSSEKKTTSLVQPLKKKPYTQEQVRNIQAAIEADTQLLNAYPFNREAIRSQQIRMEMLKSANQQI